MSESVNRFQDWAVPHPLFDSHFHALHMEKRGLDPMMYLEEAFRRGLAGAMEVAVDEHAFKERLSLAERLPNLLLSVGIHPSSVREDWGDRMSVLTTQAEHPAVRAVGETGLDREPSPLQEAAFRAHLEFAAERNLPVIIHNRESETRLLAILREHRAVKGVFHCFSSDWDVARRVLDAGLFLSFAGNLSYKKNGALREAARKAPGDRVLIETDAPYLPPQPVRGRPNHPGFLGHILITLASVRGENAETLAERTKSNAEALFLSA